MSQEAENEGKVREGVRRDEYDGPTAASAAGIVTGANVPGSGYAGLRMRHSSNKINSCLAINKSTSTLQRPPVSSPRAA